jgi:hypothetical protein
MAYILKVTYSSGTNFKQSLKDSSQLGLCESIILAVARHLELEKEQTQTQTTTE